MRLACRSPLSSADRVPPHLLNYEWLSIFLIGLPDLLDRHRSLLSRIHRRFVLAPITVDDTADCLRTRLRRAGCDRELFALEAIALIHEHASGTLREAARKKHKTVTAELLQRVVEAGGRS